MNSRNSIKDKKKVYENIPVEFIDVGKLESPIIDIDEEISQEFEAAQNLGSHKLDDQLQQEAFEGKSQFAIDSQIVAGNDPDTNLVEASMSGESSVVGGNPTPDQSDVDIIGKAMGIEYRNGEQLHTLEKIESRDVQRWELEPQSSEDYQQRSKQIFTTKKSKNL
jgi:hypothetical protein